MSIRGSSAWFISAAAVVSLAFPLSGSAFYCESQWVPRFSGIGMDSNVAALTVFNDGTGQALYAGGSFLTAGGTTVNKIARLQGDQWLPLGTGIGVGNGLVWIMTEFDDGTGTALFVGGDFTVVDGQAANHIAKWDGGTWAPVGEGTSATIRGAMTVFDDGSGPALYMGGDFATAGGIEVNYVAKWDGEEYSALGGGVSGEFHSVRALCVFDDGTGPALYAAGNFIVADGITVNGVAKWDGSTWSDVGGGVGHEPPGTCLVRGLIVHDDGTGSALYATGQFITAGGVSAPGIARWNGESWSAVGEGITSEPGSIPTGRRLVVFDNGSGPALYVGGTYTIAGGETVNYIARWDGTSWSSLESGMNDTVGALTVFDEGDGPALFVGGVFTMAGDIPSVKIAKWESICVADFDSDGDGDIDLVDFEAFADCLTGPAGSLGPDCAVFDENGDSHVDLCDFRGFQQAFAN